MLGKQAWPLCRVVRQDGRIYAHMHIYIYVCIQRCIYVLLLRVKKYVGVFILVLFTYNYRQRERARRREDKGGVVERKGSARSQAHLSSSPFSEAAARIDL